jgi:1-acyl-sn-glycerol-3-phosphate acyltransferase
VEKLWAIGPLFACDFFLSTKIVIKGKENIIKNKKFFIASSHQSMFETFFLQTVFNSPVFILKKELLIIPIFGWYLKKIGSISIKRNKVSKENLSFFDDISKQISSSERPLIIFPQGTRLLPKDRTPFKKGSSRIYEELKISCQPIAINSGNTWPKKGSKKINTILTISILKPIEPGLKKEIFLKELESVIYSELDILN